MARAKRYFQYVVTDVGGSMEGRIEKGDTTLDYWHGQTHTYSIFDLKEGELTGWYSVANAGEATPEQYAQLAEQGRNVPKKKVPA